MRGDGPGLSRPERISFSDMDLDLPTSVGPPPRVPAALNRTATPISEPALSFGELSMSFGASEVPLRPELANCLGEALRDVGEHYEIIGPLGRGRYGRVFQCVRKSDGVEFAVKRISKRRDWDPADAQRLRDEITTLRRLNHAHICGLVDVFESERDVHAVLDLCSGGELFEYIVERGHLCGHCARQITRQMCEAVAYVHSMDVTHRDLKPENILLVARGLCETSDVIAPLSIKIIDFGLSSWGGSRCASPATGDEAQRDGGTGGGGALAGEAPPSAHVAASAATVLRTDSLKSFVGTAGYMAPEIGDGQSYTRAVDAWSIGVVLYTMLCGCSPFDSAAEEDTEFRRAVLQSRTRHANAFFDFEPWPSVSPLAIDLIQQLLVVDPRARLTAEETLEHPWLSKRVLPEPGPEGERVERSGSDPAERALSHMRRALATRDAMSAFERAVFYHILTDLEAAERAVLDAGIAAVRAAPERAELSGAAAKVAALDDAAETAAATAAKEGLTRAAELELDAIAACTRNMFATNERIDSAFERFCSPPPPQALRAAASKAAAAEEELLSVNALNIDSVLKLDPPPLAVSLAVALAHALARVAAERGDDVDALSTEACSAVESDVEALFARAGGPACVRLERAAFEELVRSHCFYWRPARLQRRGRDGGVSAWESGAEGGDSEARRPPFI